MGNGQFTNDARKNLGFLDPLSPLSLSHSRHLSVLSSAFEPTPLPHIADVICERPLSLPSLFPQNPFVPPFVRRCRIFPRDSISRLGSKDRFFIALLSFCVGGGAKEVMFEVSSGVTRRHFSCFVPLARQSPSDLVTPGRGHHDVDMMSRMGMGLHETTRGNLT